MLFVRERTDDSESRAESLGNREMHYKEGGSGLIGEAGTGVHLD